MTIKLDEMTIGQALFDERLLGASLQPLEPGQTPFASWQTWGAVLKAAFALPLTDAELATFHAVAGERGLPTQRVRELWCVAGRKGGKSHMAAATACYLALFGKYKLAPGERGEVLVVASSIDQAHIVFDRIVGFLQSSPVLRKEIANTTRDEIELRNGIVIGVHACSFRSVRGRTLVAAVFDEVSFWRDESSATPDIEMYRAVRPAMLTTKGLLIGISSPYRKVGLLYQKHRDCFGVDGDILVVQGATEAFNPTINAAEERALDPTAAVSEYDAEFRRDLNAYLDDESIDRAIDDDRPLELPPQEGILYEGFVDSNAGGSDAYTAGVVCRMGDDYIIAAVRGTYRGDPEVTTKEYADLFRSYRITKVTGDNFAKEWVAGAWRKLGFEYVQSKKPKSDIFLEVIPLWLRGVVRIPNLPTLVRELRLLERQTHRSGRDTVNHPRGEHDDYANVVCGALWLLAKKEMRPEKSIDAMPIAAFGTPRNIPGGSMYAGGQVIAPPAGSGIGPVPEAPPPAPSEPSDATAPPGRVYGPDGQYWDPPPPNSPVVAKPGWLTKQLMARANAAPLPQDVLRPPTAADAKGGSAGLLVNGMRQEAWHGHVGATNESFFWGGARGRRAR
jgi:hypothetical protein